jgi:peptide/nickel transport system substrate-binding protein
MVIGPSMLGVWSMSENVVEVAGQRGGPRSAHRVAPRRARTMIAILLAMACLAVGCGTAASNRTSGPTAKLGGREPANEVPKNGGTLVVAVDAESDSWNAATAEWAAAGSIVGGSVLEPLAKLNSKGGADPYLASGWIADAAFDKWQITIRPGITFSNGEPLDANAVKLNLDTYRHGALSGQVLGPLVESVEVTGPLTVVVNLTQPWAAFPSSYLDGGAALMMAPAMIHSADGGATHPIGTGPFVFASWTPGDSFKATKNPTYWRKGLPHLDSIEFRVMTDEATRVAALKSGDVNMILTTDAVDANRLSSNYTVVKDWTSEPVMVKTNTVASINGVPNPFNNIHARLALTYATDQKQMATLQGTDVATATGPWAPSSVWGSPEDQNGYAGYNPDKAKAELREYEKETGATSLTFTLIAVSGVDRARNVQALQAQWKKAGIDVDLQMMDQVSLIKQLVSSEYEAVYGPIYNYPDPDNDFPYWSSSTIKGVGSININFSLYANAQVDHDLEVGRSDGYADQRKAAYTDMVHQLNAAAIDVWLYRTPYSLIADPNVKGLNTARDVGFGNFEPKTWLGELWLS